MAELRSDVNGLDFMPVIVSWRWRQRKAFGHLCQRQDAREEMPEGRESMFGSTFAVGTPGENGGLGPFPRRDLLWVDYGRR